MRLKYLAIMAGLALALKKLQAAAANPASPLNVQVIVDSLPKHPNKVYYTRTLDQIDTLFIHHSATPTGTPQSFANYHVNTNGWPGIAYTYVIDKSGIIYQTNYWETISYNASGHNTRSLSICLVGNFDIEVPTPMQLDSLRALIPSIEADLGWTLWKRGHNEVANKSCPGTNFNVADFLQTLDTYA